MIADPPNPAMVESYRSVLIRVYYQVKPYLPKMFRWAMRRSRAAGIRRRHADVWPINEAAGNTPEGWPGWPDGKRFALVLMLRAALQEKAGESPVATYAEVLTIFPQFDPARVALARAYLDDPTQLDAAEKLATAARVRLKEDPDLSGILAILNFRKGQFDYAAQLLMELTTKRPLTGRELFALGMSQAATKRSADALKTLTKALKSQLPEADASSAKATLEKLSNPDAKE